MIPCKPFAGLSRQQRRLPNCVAGGSSRRTGFREYAAQKQAHRHSRRTLPEFTHLLRNPNLPTALALRSRFPTPAALAQASFWELREARGRTCSVSDAKLRELQQVAT